MKKRKVKETTKGFNPDNCLGWTEEEFALMMCRIALFKMRNNIRLTSDEIHIWCDYGDDFQTGRLERMAEEGREVVEKEEKQAEIDKLKEEIERLENENV